jgi:hypothetical protein
MFNREMAIQELVNDDFTFFMQGNGPGLELLDSYLINGFKGYNNYTDEELISELEDRDISYLFNGDDNINIEIDDISHIGE